MVSRKLDPVARRLSQGGDSQSSSVLGWLEGQQQRMVMHRRALWCAIAGWSMLTTAAIVSSVFAVVLSRDMREIFRDELLGYSSLPWTIMYLPIGLVVIAIALTIGGIVCFLTGRFPGLSATATAIDWSSASDAVTRLLSIGCTYPEAFRTAAGITRQSTSRRWLFAAAERVEQGQTASMQSAAGRGDAAILELMLQANEGEPQLQWRLAADHFLEVAHRRLVLLMQSWPMIATILSGFLLWISISATLGWMWRAVAQMIRGLN